GGMRGESGGRGRAGGRGWVEGPPGRNGGRRRVALRERAAAFGQLQHHREVPRAVLRDRRVLCQLRGKLSPRRRGGQRAAGGREDPPAARGGDTLHRDGPDGLPPPCPPPGMTTQPARDRRPAISDRLDLQKIAVKILSNAPATVSLDPFIAIFGRWRTETDHPAQWLDLADYAHMPRGPGIVLVGRNANFSFDLGSAAPG